jgi:hypothetical protein
MRHPWRMTVPPTHPYPPFDSVMVRNERAEAGSRSPKPKAHSPQPTAQSPKPTAHSPQPKAHSRKPTAESPQPKAAVRALSCLHCFSTATSQLSRVGVCEFAGPCPAWMRGTSLQGRIYGVSRGLTHPRPAQYALGMRLLEAAAGQPQGWIYGVSRKLTHPRPAQYALGMRLLKAAASQPPRTDVRRVPRTHTPPPSPVRTGNAAFRSPSRSGFFKPISGHVLAHVFGIPDAAVHGDVDPAGQRLHRADRATDVELRV